MCGLGYQPPRHVLAAPTVEEGLVDWEGRGFDPFDDCEERYSIWSDRDELEQVRQDLEEDLKRLASTVRKIATVIPIDPEAERLLDSEMRARVGGLSVKRPLTAIKR